MKKHVDRFIEDHTHINYCEAIIYPDGQIEYAQPSHTMALECISGLPREVIYKLMPITASPIHWLTDFTGCIPVWTNGYMKSNRVTNEQEIAWQKLIQTGLVKDNAFR